MLQGHTDYVRCVAKTSNNKYIVSGGEDKTVRIWNLKAKTQEAVLQGHTDLVTSIAITSDSKYIVSGGKNNTVRIWNLRTALILDY